MIIKYDLHDPIRIRDPHIGWYRSQGKFCTQSGVVVKICYNLDLERYDHLFECSCGGRHQMWVDCDEIELDIPGFYKDFEDKIKDRLL